MTFSLCNQKYRCRYLDLYRVLSIVPSTSHFQLFLLSLKKTYGCYQTVIYLKHFNRKNFSQNLIQKLI
ncbi:hypothetical protein E1A91_D12G012300v1 [Gossypium mustelinum]|uniref:Uncharacterized protein n=1 Tax=Gossypium mustelinum TaxID=34275 RepID=A0A5D2S912_GOSMU|nr:hypothetical protein E1A91_D12G012300v1 [Gossypium mustelinum]